jgi:hypothetical protein
VTETNLQFPEDQALLALIKGRVEEARATGIVLGVLDADGTRRIVAYGNPGPGACLLGSESVFEIGSISAWVCWATCLPPDQVPTTKRWFETEFLTRWE